ncbi:MAG: HEAT repeat domain-containing protein [Myxococcales bacterium]|nr:HEAT repeat domain-containing protein [Myxococcales bacterium]
MKRDRLSTRRGRARGEHSALLVACAVAIASDRARADWPTAQRDPSSRIEAATAARRSELLTELAARDPTGAERVIIRALEDPDERVRATAAELAGRLRIRAAREPILRWLDDPQASLRAAAARALATIGDATAIPALTRLFNDRDSDVKLAAVQAVGVIGGQAAVVPLLDRLSDDDSDVRIAAARALGELGDARAVLSLLGVLQDPTAEVREAVCTALGRLRDERALRGIVALLRDSMPEVRLAAARAIGVIGAQAAVVDLAPIALGADYIGDISQRTELARAAVASVGRIGGPAAVDLLVRVFRTSTSQDVSRAATDALRSLGDRARAAIPALAAEPVPPSARDALAALLGELGNDDAADALLGLTDGSRPSSPDTYLRALGRTGSQRALYALLRTATERESATTRQTSFGAIATATPARRSAALRAIEAWVQRRGSLEPGALDPLLVILREVQRAPTTGTVTARSTQAPSVSADMLLVIKLIGSTRNPRAPAALAPLLANPDRTQRIAVAQAFTRVGIAGIERAVVGLLSDNTPPVRSAASDALARFGDRAALDALWAAWDGDRPIDRASAAIAIGRITERVRDGSRAQRFIAALDDARPPVAAAIVDALGGFAATGSQPALAALERVSSGRGPLANAATEALSNAAHSAEPSARGAIVRALTERLGAANAEQTRSAAAWGLGASSQPETVALLLAATRDPSNAIATNALGAVARSIRGGFRATDAVRSAACDALARRTNPAVRANALSLLAAARQRCESDVARRALSDARSPWIRRAAAEALVNAATDDAARRVAHEALTRCATTDRTPWVAERCRALDGQPSALPERGPEPIDALVLGEDEDAPAVATAYVLFRPDGLARFGVTGSSGWLHERPSPAGEFAIYDPTQLASEQ